MRFSWSQHLEASRTIGSAADQHSGMALALMGVAMLVLLQDLERQHHPLTSEPFPRDDLGEAASH